MKMSRIVDGCGCDRRSDGEIYFGRVVDVKVYAVCVSTRRVSAPAATNNMNAADPIPLTRRWDTTAPTK